ncbi:MAG: hypothetical protein KGZ93_10355 [Actinobacteria bacterium]|nr:hypothetical protein [Actinomycetota bacterium]
MLERVIENWLDRASEKSFQIPFSHMLINEGYKIIHVSRHCGMELGKDIIAIDADGTPCAFQLKGAKNGKISLSQWREDSISAQLQDLVMTAIDHPSVDATKPHRSFFVTNGNLEEEVSRAISDMNRTWERQGQPYGIETIVRGEFLEMALNLGTNLLPSGLPDTTLEQRFLQLFQEMGNDVLPKEKLTALIESVLPFGYVKTNDRSRKPSKAACSRAISGAAVLCSISTSSFDEKNNHVAVIEAWVIFLSYTLALAERWDLDPKYWKNEFEMAKQAIYNKLEDLYDEVKEAPYLTEGNALADPPFYRVRLTWLVAYMSILGLWRRFENKRADETDVFIKEFCLENRRKLYMWGEAAAPQFLAAMWYQKKVISTPEPDFLLKALIEVICHVNKPKGEELLANPYYDANSVMPHLLGIAEKPLDERFRGNSYVLEGLVHLFVRRNFKQHTWPLWPDVTRISVTTFKPKKLWHLYKWNNREGVLEIAYPKHTQDWSELRTMAQESGGAYVPKLIKTEPVLFLLFLCVYPHRMNASIMRWLDSELMRI